MTVYESISSLPASTFSEWIRRGVLRPNIRRDMEVYRHYCSLLDSGYRRMDALTTTSDKYNISEETTGRIIRKMR